MARITKPGEPIPTPTEGTLGQAIAEAAAAYRVAYEELQRLCLVAVARGVPLREIGPLAGVSYATISRWANPNTRQPKHTSALDKPV